MAYSKVESSLDKQRRAECAAAAAVKAVSCQLLVCLTACAMTSCFRVCSDYEVRLLCYHRPAATLDPSDAATVATVVVPGKLSQVSTP